MRVPCRVQLFPTNVPTGTQSCAPAKAIVIIGRAPSSLSGDKGKRKLWLLVCTTSSKAKGGVRLQLESNLQQLKYDGTEGKATLLLKSPPRRIVMQGDQAKMRQFTLMVQRMHKNPTSVLPSELTPLKYADPNAPELQARLAVDENRTLPTTYPPNLEYLSIAKHSLRTMPQPILKLRLLTCLELPENKLTGLPEGFATAFPCLAALKLPLNRLEEFPLQICNMALHVLDLSGNRIADIPSQICHMGKLFSLNMENNKVMSVPANIHRMTTLKRLNLSGNSIHDLPSSFKMLQLERLDLSRNPFRMDQETNKMVVRMPFIFPSLKEMAARTVLRQGEPIEELYLPCDLECYLLGADICSQCHGAALETSKSLVTKYDTSGLASTLGLHSQWNNLVPIAEKICSVQCLHKRFKIKRRDA